ncbi:MAG: Ppx/GppA phosphatase family protein [Actinomycetota bacterium]
MHAAIDIGTNSFHLVVARGGTEGGFEVVTTEKDMVRLGSQGEGMRRLSPDGIERGVKALTRMVEVAHSLGADIRAVATSAVREAENRAEFVERVERELGISVEVVSGTEEARLIHHGVVHAIPVGDQRCLIVDIGGGSTEFIVGDGPTLIEPRSLRLGAIRLTTEYLGEMGEEAPTMEARLALRAHLRGALDGVSRDLGRLQPELAIGSSGTISTVAEIIAAERRDDVRNLNGFTFTAAELKAATQRVVTSTLAERKAIKGLDERRADIIVGGIVLLDEIFAAFGLEEMTVSEYALREGVLFDRFPAGAEHLRDLRRSNALRLARQLDPDSGHAVTAANLATTLFDETAAIHGLEPSARELLEVAGLLHNVGMFISHSGHHKHSYYVIRNSERLTGFTEHEVELVALIARYHRRSLPTQKHRPFAALSADDQYLVSVCAGLLRVAIGLDRRHRGLVVSVATEYSEKRKKLTVLPRVAKTTDLAVEIAAATERSALLAGVLEADVVVGSPVAAAG